MSDVRISVLRKEVEVGNRKTTSSNGRASCCQTLAGIWDFCLCGPSSFLSESCLVGVTLGSGELRTYLGTCFLVRPWSEKVTDPWLFLLVFCLSPGCLGKGSIP